MSRHSIDFLRLPQTRLLGSCEIDNNHFFEWETTLNVLATRVDVTRCINSLDVFRLSTEGVNER